VVTGLPVTGLTVVKSLFIGAVSADQTRRDATCKSLALARRRISAGNQTDLASAVSSLSLSLTRPLPPSVVRSSSCSSSLSRRANPSTHGRPKTEPSVLPTRLPSPSYRSTANPARPRPVADKFAICENDVGVVTAAQSNPARFRAQFNRRAASWATLRLLHSFGYNQHTTDNGQKESILLHSKEVTNSPTS